MDPNNIIRNIEYWDIERKRYHKYNYCAIIVAEEITGRFMNVIPLIVIQLSAFKDGDNYSLVFTKIIYRLTLGSDDEDQFEVTDRKY